MSIANEDIFAQAYLGIPTLLDSVPCLVAPISIKELGTMGEEKYGYYLKILLTDVDEIIAASGDGEKNAAAVNQIKDWSNLEYLCNKAKNKSILFL